ncbi:MAG: MXAN_6640 family putative metalloprotease [Melioribacteraceae bacterium]
MIKRIMILLLIVNSSVFSQEESKMIDSYLKLKNKIPMGMQIQSLDFDSAKCGLSVTGYIRTHFDSFTPKEKMLIKAASERPERDTSFVTPRGFFRIHFNKSGSETPGYDINRFALSADSAYDYEINALKYPTPPTDNQRGGDNLYDIYIVNLSGGVYGYMEFEDNITDNTYQSYTVIENDFSNYATKGLDAARVTIAHEFHHAIQIGNYTYRSEDNYYFEATSTAMEEFVFDDVNDYYHYIDSYLRNTTKALDDYNGYNLALLNIFLKDRFGIGIIKTIWENMISKRAVNSINSAIELGGSRFDTEFNLFGLWNYFTNKKAQNGYGYEEAEFYPSNVKPGMTIDFSRNTQTVTVSSKPISNNYCLFSNENEFVSLITNSDLESSVAQTQNSIDYNYTLSPESFMNSAKIANGYYSLLQSSYKNLLYESDILNDEIIDKSILSEKKDYAFPQPFNYSKHNVLYLPAPDSDTFEMELSVFDVSMNLVFNGNVRRNVNNMSVVQWMPINKNYEKLGSGIYIYIAKSGDNTKHGKFAILND